MTAYILDTDTWLGPSEDFGVAGAILAGDLCLSWCDEMYAGSGLPAERLAAGRAVFDRMFDAARKRRLQRGHHNLQTFRRITHILNGFFNVSRDLARLEASNQLLYIR